MWTIFMVTDLVLSKLIVAHTFNCLNLTTMATGLATHIPDLLGLSHIEAYEHVVTALGKFGIVVILDNHRQQQFLWRPVLQNEAMDSRLHPIDWYKYIQCGVPYDKNGCGARSTLFKRGCEISAIKKCMGFVFSKVDFPTTTMPRGDKLGIPL